MGAAEAASEKWVEYKGSYKMSQVLYNGLLRNGSSTRGSYEKEQLELCAVV